MGFKSFLKGFLWFNNMVLLLLGAAVALYAAVLLSEFDKERRGGSEDTPAAPPPLTVPTPSALDIPRSIAARRPAARAMRGQFARSHAQRANRRSRTRYEYFGFSDFEAISVTAEEWCAGTIRAFDAAQVFTRDMT